MIFDSYEYRPAAYVTKNCMMWPFNELSLASWLGRVSLLDIVTVIRNKYTAN
jgi:hypothetical protein